MKLDKRKIKFHRIQIIRSLKVMNKYKIILINNGMLKLLFTKLATPLPEIYISY